MILVVGEGEDNGNLFYKYPADDSLYFLAESFHDIVDSLSIDLS